jgi:hypothetical protein
VTFESFIDFKQEYESSGLSIMPECDSEFVVFSLFVPLAIPRKRAARNIFLFYSLTPPFAKSKRNQYYLL